MEPRITRMTRMFFEHGLIRVIRVIRGQNRPRITVRLKKTKTQRCGDRGQNERRARSSLWSSIPLCFKIDRAPIRALASLQRPVHAASQSGLQRTNGFPISERQSDRRKDLRRPKRSTSRNVERVTAAAAELSGVTGRSLDVTDPESIDAVFDAAGPVDILVNGRIIAHGEVLVLNDNFCVRVAEILTPDV